MTEFSAPTGPPGTQPRAYRSAASHTGRPGQHARRSLPPTIRSPPAANPLRFHDAHRNLQDHPNRRHDRRRRADQPGNDHRPARRTRHGTSSSQRRTRCPTPTRGWSAKRPQQDSNLRTRLRRPMLYPLSYGGCATWERVPAASPSRTLSRGHAAARGASRGAETLPSRS